METMRELIEDDSERIYPIRGGLRKGFPNCFSPVTSTNVGIIPQDFLTFSFNPFSTV